jgi:hypothetical protein
MTQAIIQTNLDELLADCGTIDTVSWQAPKHMTYAQWAEIGSKFQYVVGSLNWWLGDWLAEGEKRYGETYTQAVELTGHKQDHLMKCKQIAEAVQKRTRVQVLSWTHHRYVSHLPEAEQRLWLEHAAEHELSSRDLKQALELANAHRKPLAQPDFEWMPEEPKIPPLPSIYTNGTTGQQSMYKTYDSLIDDSVDESQYDFDKPREQRYTIIDEYGIEQTVVVGADEKLKVIPAEDSETEEHDSDEYYTPEYIIDAARSVLGHIDLDPASCELAQTVVQADVYYDKTEDGLKKTWLGNVWLNPPFSEPKLFIAKIIGEYESGNVNEAIVLTNNSTDSAWGQSLLSRYPVCFVGASNGRRSRISFWKETPNKPEPSNRYSQMIFYLGKEPQKFFDVFSEFGSILEQHVRL